MEPDEAQKRAWRILNGGIWCMKGDIPNRLNWLGQPCGSHFSSLEKAKEEARSSMIWGAAESDIQIIDTPFPEPPLDTPQPVSHLHRAWKVVAGTLELWGFGDWPGDYRYWTTQEEAERHAAKTIKEARLKAFHLEQVKAVEADPPENTNMFPTYSYATEEQGRVFIYHGPRGGRFTHKIGRDGKSYRRYF